MTNWGSREEVYRHKCMTLLRYRYHYYVLHSPLISDIEYDKLEHELEEYEKQNPDIVHEKSPTKVPGSSNAHDYPRSIRMLYPEPKVQEVKQVKKAVLW